MEPSTFGARLRQLRERAGITPYALAQKSGVARSYIGELEQGKKAGPSWDVAMKLADALGVGIEEFTASK